MAALQSLTPDSDRDPHTLLLSPAGWHLTRPGRWPDRFLLSSRIAMIADVFRRVIRSIKSSFSKTGRPVVLCAEDDEAIRALCSAGLKRAGYAVDVAADGREAMSMLENKQYAAVLLDLGLPFVHGATLLSLLRQKNPELLRKLIVVTGISDAALVDIEPHVHTVLRKPVTVERLVDAVRDCSAPDTLIIPRSVA